MNKKNHKFTRKRSALKHKDTTHIGRVAVPYYIVSLHGLKTTRVIMVSRAHKYSTPDTDVCYAAETSDYYEACVILSPQSSWVEGSRGSSGLSEHQENASGPCWLQPCTALN